MISLNPAMMGYHTNKSTKESRGTGLTLSTIGEEAGEHTGKLPCPTRRSGPSMTERDLAGVCSSRDFTVIVSILDATCLAGIAEATAARPATMKDPIRILIEVEFFEIRSD